MPGEGTGRNEGKGGNAIDTCTMHMHEGDEGARHTRPRDRTAQHTTRARSRPRYNIYTSTLYSGYNISYVLR